jgi:7-keto-8-aminopelargonate synthetase-like enzyme
MVLMFSSYDSLGLIGDPRIDGATIEAIKKYGRAPVGARSRQSSQPGRATP